MVLDYFREISSIPRGSRFNTKISNYLVEFAKKHGFDYVQDEAENVVIYKPAAKGYESCPPLIMQGHMDMVCEKVSEDAHDFQNDGIKLITKDNYITADGTTLGADDGIALAYMLEFLADDNLVCPPLEMVFTTDEEIGMIGAMSFDAGVLRGKHMINLDTEDEKGFIAACAGGVTARTDIPVNRVTRDGVQLVIDIAGLKGGHSGVDIDKNRSNAVLLIGRLLAYLPEEYFGIIDICGGNKDNVIPNEAYVRLVVDADKIEELSEMCSEAAVILSDELTAAEPGLEISITEDSAEAVKTYDTIDSDSYAKLFYYLTYVPNGIQVMSASIPGMVESSQNLGILKIEDNFLKISVSMRSQKPSYKEYMTKKLEGMASMLDAVFEVSGDYPGYDMAVESQFRDMMCNVYEDSFGRKPEISSIHAGLEIGVFASKMPGLDIISIGPDTLDIHTVDERVDIESIHRVEKFLRNAVKTFAENTVK